MSLLWLSITASAQTTNPLHQFNSAVRKLVSQVTPSVVQVIATGYGPVESSGRNSTALTGEELRSALNHTTANSPVVLQIERSGKLMFVAFKLGEN